MPSIAESDVWEPVIASSIDRNLTDADLISLDLAAELPSYSNISNQVPHERKTQNFW